MNQLNKKEVIQAVIIADNFTDNFLPLTNNSSSSLLNLVNVPAIDYVLESANRSGIEEVFLFASLHIDQLKKHIQFRKAENCSWSLGMVVNIVSSETCQSLGDALRDLDAKGLIRGHFILLGSDTITNAQLLPLLEEHKRICKYDKGAAMTVVYKKTTPYQRTGDEVLLATDNQTKRLLFHQRLKQHHKERHFNLPLEIFLTHNDVMLHHDLIDPQIAICAPSVLPLFADNFDFQTRDDFVHGVLINEEILSSSIYFAELPKEQYAARVSNWQTYQIVSKDIVNRWVYPLVPDMGVCSLRQHYSFLRNNIYRNRNTQLKRGSVLKCDVVINENSEIHEKTTVENSVIGRNCRIGENCKITNSFIFDDCLIENNCILDHCVIGKGVKIYSNSIVNDGAVLGHEVEIPKSSKISKYLIQSKELDSFDAEGSVKLGEKAYTIPDPNEEATDADGSEHEHGERIEETVIRMSKIQLNYTPSEFSLSSEENDSRPVSPVQEDASIFLSEVIESLKRCFTEKSNPDYVILEINSSRYAYAMSLPEVNFYVAKAILQMSIIEEYGENILVALKALLAHLGSVVKNYIRGDAAMSDCLKAIEEFFNQNEIVRPKLAQVIHFLYDKELLTEDAILLWHEQISEESNWMKTSLAKLIAWLEQSSEEESSDDEE
uniref:Translation initiation factor eIF2B subunit epsilon n=1 Tax=Corethrella appendiculata TaxID=1370023 RepID=U5EJL2_9DIPT